MSGALRAAISVVRRIAPILLSSQRGTDCFVPNVAAPTWMPALSRGGIKSYSDVGAATGLRFCLCEAAERKP